MFSLHAVARYSDSQHTKEPQEQQVYFLSVSFPVGEYTCVLTLIDPFQISICCSYNNAIDATFDGRCCIKNCLMQGCGSGWRLSGSDIKKHKFIFFLLILDNHEKITVFELLLSYHIFVIRYHKKRIREKSSGPLDVVGAPCRVNSLEKIP